MADTAGGWAIIGDYASVIWAGALVICALLIIVLMPLVRDFAIAIPTHRSSHSRATPQWGGLAICGAILAVTMISVVALHRPDSASSGLLALLLGALLLVVLGGIDDARGLGAGVKLIVQAFAVALMLVAVPEKSDLLPLVPAWLERIMLFFGALWFVNLVNFMDGIDWMMVAEVVPITAGVAFIGALGALPAEALILALAVNGAMLGFAPFNRPVARLFMGDTGSLPIGLLLAWLLIVVAGAGYLVAAIILPLYFLADTGTTLYQRARAGERLWIAHRTHFYQRARDNGLSNIEIIYRVLAVNVALVVLAVLSTIAQSQISQYLALLAASCLVGWLMLDLARRRH
ncbi:MAG: glycosyl transferase [Hyphomicrobium sp.]|jgi:UDP-N-acetylmuramyl pentapeptide phosphotransferase/UDP-N-acetylglucosamine-1-phosphate transferase